MHAQCVHIQLLDSQGHHTVLKQWAEPETLTLSKSILCCSETSALCVHDSQDVFYGAEKSPSGVTA